MIEPLKAAQVIGLGVSVPVARAAAGCATVAEAVALQLFTSVMVTV